MSKPTVWRLQERYLEEGKAGLKSDKTRSSLPMGTKLKVIAKAVPESPANATQWSYALMAKAMGISPPSARAFSRPGNTSARP